MDSTGHVHITVKNVFEFPNPSKMKPVHLILDKHPIRAKSTKLLDIVRENITL